MADDTHSPRPTDGTNRIWNEVWRCWDPWNFTLYILKDPEELAEFWYVVDYDSQQDDALRDILWTAGIEP